MSTFQEQMTGGAGPSKPRFTGWLTMAPEVDAPRPPAPTTDIPPTAQSSSSGTYAEQPAPSTHGFGYLGQQVKLPQRRKRRAVFQVGSPGLSDHESASSSSRSRASSNAPEFDVRASFAPMPAYGASVPAQKPSSTYRGVGDPALRSQPATSAKQEISGSEDEADGLSFGGRRWKGKTVHAVELELEALRDERLMSHAPDAAYLASRLEGVRRNLEIEERRPSYVPYDEDLLSDEEEVALAPSAAEVVRELYPFQHRPVSNASSVSLVEGETPHDLPFEDDIKLLDPEQISLSSLPMEEEKVIDPAARGAALDARVEVRPLRRGDLEQVRELHAFHGDSDRAPDHGETYASTASFLLRLLVDDRHVCLVAVAKPIPAPAAPLPDLRGHSSTQKASASESGTVSPASAGLTSLHIDGDGDEGISSLSTSPAAPSSLFSTTPGVAPTAPETKVIRPRAPDGRINNTPATSVFLDIFAERGHPIRKPTHLLPGPTELPSVRKVLSIPPPGGVTESETILGVVSAQVSVVPAASEDTFFGSKKEIVEEATGLVDVHLLTLATAPEERGQGLGAKLLAALHGECMSKARLLALRLRQPAPLVPALNPNFVELKNLACTLFDLRPTPPPRGKYLTRTYLEVHPSNSHALALYRAHGFAAPTEDARAVKRGFYRGDVRIAAQERSRRGGTDAWILERFDGPLTTS